MKKFLKRIRKKLQKLFMGFTQDDYRALKKQVEESKKREAGLQKQLQNTVQKLDRLEKHFWVYAREVHEKHKRVSNRITYLEKLLYGPEMALNEEKRNPQIIISLTSFPQRAIYVPIVVERMLMQTMKPDRIVLWLSKEQFPNREGDLPETVLELQKYGVEIKWCDGDMKAYKKILPALKEYPDDLIIIIDDDLIYDLDFVERLYKGHLMHPDAIIASRVHKIKLSKEDVMLPYEQWVKEADFDVYEARDDWFFTGGAGTLFPPHIFSEEVFRQEIIKELCPYADDIWLNIQAATCHVPIVNAACNRYLTYIDGSQEIRLVDINLTKNDEQLKNLAVYYKDQLKESIYNKISKEIL